MEQSVLPVSGVLGPTWLPHHQPARPALQSEGGANRGVGGRGGQQGVGRGGGRGAGHSLTLGHPASIHIVNNASCNITHTAPAGRAAPEVGGPGQSEAERAGELRPAQEGVVEPEDAKVRATDLQRGTALLPAPRPVRPGPRPAPSACSNSW